MAEKKFFVDINLQGSALTNAKIGTNTGIGSTEGAFGYDSSAHRLQYFDGTATKEVANLSDIAAVTGGLIFQGGYDPTTNTPDITDGSALKGFFWAVTAAGTFLGESVQVGDSIVAKVDNAGTTLSDWLILQGNIVIATDSVDGISRLATQTEANDGTEAGAVVITPATLQGKIDAQITPEINSKVSKSGDTMSGTLDMGTNNITNVGNGTFDYVYTDRIAEKPGSSDIKVDISLDFQNSSRAINLPAPINGGDATNKTYVDDNTSNKLPLAGGTMSGNIDMGGNDINGAGSINTQTAYTEIIYVSELTSNATGDPIQVFSNLNLNNGLTITNLPAPTNGTDATNKTYVDGVGATAEQNAKDYADSLAPNYDPAGSATTAENNAKAYADSLAPNYDPAGSASTAESNANAYTDTQIAARSYSSTILTSAWELQMDGSYGVTITHNLNLASTYGAVINFYNDNNGESELVELAISGNNVNSFIARSNFLPTSTMAVSIIKA